MTEKLNFRKIAGSLLAIGLLSATLMADTSTAARYDTQVQNAVTQKLARKWLIWQLLQVRQPGVTLKVVRGGGHTGVAVDLVRIGKAGHEPITSMIVNN